jgi:transmembrane sensor
MSNHTEQIKLLFDKYAAGTASTDETKQLFKMIAEGQDDNELKELLLGELTNTDLQDNYDLDRWNNVLNKVKAENELNEYDAVPKRYLRIRQWSIAAAILLVFSFGGYFLLHKPVANTVAALKPGVFKNDALPGNKAYITLANGKQIAVTTAANGQIAVQGNTLIQKSASGEIVYNAGNAEVETTYNTFTVPRGGGKHTIQLADGTSALLDAGSSIRYPVAFTGKERKVSITGQVYFEVVHKATQPFLVSVKGETIEDIGTHFNINAFEDEPVMRTTLLEGSIAVSGILLKPGQQAVKKADGKITVLDQVDEEKVMAWKNDLFRFTKNTSLYAVMNELSRWYDLEVVYTGTNKDYHFGGYMSRDSKLSSVLRILQVSGLKFSLDGKKLIVYN